MSHWWHATIPDVILMLCYHPWRHIDVMLSSLTSYWCHWTLDKCHLHCTVNIDHSNVWTSAPWEQFDSTQVEITIHGKNYYIFVQSDPVTGSHTADKQPGRFKALLHSARWVNTAYSAGKNRPGKATMAQCRTLRGTYYSHRIIFRVYKWLRNVSMTLASQDQLLSLWSKHCTDKKRQMSLQKEQNWGI